eukprot:11614798-Heterocapsa_arctica.AAC.1
MSGAAMPDPGLAPFKRKVRFNDNDYSYALKKIRAKAPRPVVRDPNPMYAKDLMSQAVARFRAIELANSRGLVNDPADTELWMGVERSSPHGESKALRHLD